jgi:hypothetical protein
MMVSILLENGIFLKAKGFGANTTKVGEIVFNTSYLFYEHLHLFRKGKIWKSFYDHYQTYHSNKEFHLDNDPDYTSLLSSTSLYLLERQYRKDLINIQVPKWKSHSDTVFSFELKKQSQGVGDLYRTEKLYLPGLVQTLSN